MPDSITAEERKWPFEGRLAFDFTLPHRNRSVKSVGMSSMLFGGCAGGAVSSDSSTLHESVYPLLVASPCRLPLLSSVLGCRTIAHWSAGAPYQSGRHPLVLVSIRNVLEVSRDLVRVRNGKTAMYGVTTLLSSFHHVGVGLRWSLEGVYSCWEAFLVAQQRFLDSTQVDEVLASCVITSTTGIPSLIRLLSGHIPMCVVIIDPVVVLSPQPTLAELYTPIPQASSGRVSDVVQPW
ncbi:hypothetical protein EDD16DRAFT_1711776 [Pisolithus croceorrhizus]|nr:hypothetical protein EDD16DRAFT_1711776 [Pisolithus croceorrhizus]